MATFDKELSELLAMQANYVDTIENLNDQLNETNEELKQQKEELLAINNELELKNKQIKYQSEKLAQINQTLQEKNEDIIASLTYASRLQRAILPPVDMLDYAFSEKFILYKPREIVSGDFYWMIYDEPTETLFFAVGDATGHGIPGALMSFLAITTLNKVVREYKITDPGEILTKSREVLLENFAQKGEKIYDGFDIALCSVKGNDLKFAGAYNSLLMIRDDRMQEYKGDRAPIGHFDI